MLVVEYFYRLPERAVQCTLCPWRCVLYEGAKGKCGNYTNYGGELACNCYGQVEVFALEPLEKKPLYHYGVGMQVLSVGTHGCTLRCDTCHNRFITHTSESQHVVRLTPQQVVETALSLREQRNVGVAFTYNEPTVWYPYVLHTLMLAKSHGLRAVLVTNGLIHPRPLKALLPFVDALQVDVKSYHDDTYLRLCHGPPGCAELVRSNVALMHKEEKHIEVTTLLLDETILPIAQWLGDLEPLIPLHLPLYRTPIGGCIPSTPAEFVDEQASIARKYLAYVYTDQQRDTVCARCGAVVVSRRGFRVTGYHLNDEGVCACGEPVVCVPRFN